MIEIQTEEHLTLEELAQTYPELVQAKVEEGQTHKHILTHQRIFAKFFHAHFEQKEVFEQLAARAGGSIYTFEEAQLLPKPILIANYLTFRKRNFSFIR